MRRLILVTIILLDSIFIIAQDIVSVKSDTVLPQFKKKSTINTIEFRKWIQSKLDYPITNSQKPDQGTVIIKFQLTSEGKIDSIDIINEVSPAIDKEAIRVIKKSESLWTPASINGKMINFNFVMPITFFIEGDVAYGVGTDYIINKGNEYLVKSDYKNAALCYSVVIKLKPFNKDIVQKKILCDSNLYNKSDLEKDLKLLNFLVNKR